MNVAVPVPRQVTTVHTPACPWTWRELPSRQTPIRVSMPPSRWRVGCAAPRDGEMFTEEAILLHMNIAAESLPSHGWLADHFARELTLRDLVSTVGGIHLWERAGPRFPMVTAWAYVVPACCPVHDPLPVDLDIVYEWMDVVVLEVEGANRIRRDADPSAPPVDWTLRIHFETLRALRALRRQEGPESLWDYLASALMHTVMPALKCTTDGEWTIYGYPLDVTSRVSPGQLHAHQILPGESS